VVATGRRPETVREAVEDAEDLLVVRLDVTVSADARPLRRRRSSSSGASSC
jgi:hypothetical protein